MQTVIYADILIFLNSIITLFILLITSDLLKTDIRRLRLFTGSVLGGIFSLIILAPEMNSILVIITRFLISLIVVIVTFKTDSLKTVIKAVILSFIITVLFGGTVSLIMFNFFSENIYVNNGFIYFDINIFVLIISIVSFYSLFKAIHRFFIKKRKVDIIYNVELSFNSNKILIHALFDTGNTMKDIYNNKPVILLSITEAKKLLNYEDCLIIENFVTSEICTDLPQGFRLLPVRTLGSEKLLPAFTADSATVFNHNIRKIITKPSIVITNDCFDKNEYSAVINNNALGEYLI